MSIRTALIVVDLQPDFMPGGALPVAEGDRVVAPIRDLLLSGRFDVVVATQDWHPRHHASFASAHPGKRPFEQIDLYGHPQTLWPDHCVQGSAGAEIHSRVPLARISAIIRKGNDPLCDSYSAIRNNWNAKGERPRTGLTGYLRERGVASIFLCGLARDFCVKWTAEDARDEGFRVCVLWDLTRPVVPDSDAMVRRDLASRGIGIADSTELQI